MTSGPGAGVRITKLQGLSACEITVGQFRRFVKDEGYRTKPERHVGSGFNSETGKFERTSTPGAIRGSRNRTTTRWSTSVPTTRWSSATG